MTSVNEYQVGGNHYSGAAVQHWDWVAQNNIGYLEGCATKYVARWRKKGGKQDLLKARHFTQKARELFAAGLLPTQAHRRMLPEEQRVPLAAFTGPIALPAKELQICHFLSTWTGDEDLEAAQTLIEQLIDEADGAA